MLGPFKCNIVGVPVCQQGATSHQCAIPWPCVSVTYQSLGSEDFGYSIAPLLHDEKDGPCPDTEPFLISQENENLFFFQKRYCWDFEHSYLLIRYGGILRLDFHGFLQPQYAVLSLKQYTSRTATLCDGPMLMGPGEEQFERCGSSKSRDTGVGRAEKKAGSFWGPARQVAGTNMT